MLGRSSVGVAIVRATATKREKMVSPLCPPPPLASSICPLPTTQFHASPPQSLCVRFPFPRRGGYVLRSRPFVTPEKDEEESARLGSLEGTAFGTHTSSCPAMWNTPEYALLYYVPSATKHLSSSFPSLIASCRWHRQRRGKCTRSDAAHTCGRALPKCPKNTEPKDANSKYDL